MTVKPDVSRQALLFALCHELGNLIAGVRLQAHILGEDLTPRELALASLELDEIGARSGALLALVRPLADEVAGSREKVSPAAILSAVEASLEGAGGRGLELSVDVVRGLPELETRFEVIVPLLASLGYAALDHARPGSRVKIGATERDALVSFEVEDGAAASDLDEWPGGELRGRTLLCAVAVHLLLREGGRVVIQQTAKGTRIELVLRASEAQSG